MGSGLFSQTENAKQKQEESQVKENATLTQYETVMGQIMLGQYSDGSWNSEKNVNTPKLMPGMKGIYWDEDGNKTTVTMENYNNWYDYQNQKWANAETADGSLWVWIPRYEYKINTTNETIDDGENGTIEVTNGTIDVKFIPTSTTTVEEGYTHIHPAFQDGSANNYVNGEWDEEVPGFWVAKFPAGYAGKDMNDMNNDANIVDTGETYSGTYNNVKNYYEDIISGTTTMKYPVFMGQTYVYNWMNVGDSYKLAKTLTKDGNPYGLSNNTTDSHLMKNSEWGALAYLTHSQYGLNGQNILKINNIRLNHNVIHAITGYAGEGTDTERSNIGIEEYPIETLGDSIKRKNCRYKGGNYIICMVYRRWTKRK